MTSEQVLIVIIICAIIIVTIIFGVAIVELQLRIDKLEDKLNKND